MRFLHRGRLWPAALALVAACSHPYERAPSTQFAHSGFRADAASANADVRDLPDVDGSLESYIARALAAHPTLRARYHEWRAAASDVSVAGKLPEPRITYGFFARSVETRVGPQNHRLSVSQSVPWPTVVTRASDAAADRARASERIFEAEVLAVRLRVASSYWSLWRTRRQRTIHTAHRDLLRELGGAIRARVEVDRASLADASQIDLAVSRMEDEVQALGALEREQSAALATAFGADDVPERLPTTTPPATPATPRPSRAKLVAAALEHPSIRRFEHLANAAEAAGQSVRATGLPSLSLGIDYIQTGEAASPMTPDSGKDAVIVSAGLSIPLWRGSYDAAERRERSRKAAARANAAATRLDIRRNIDTAIARVDETARQIQFINGTLVPQAEAVYAAQVGSYATGGSTLANVLIAQEQVLELRLALAEQRAAHERAWSELELAVGGPVERERGGPGSESGPASGGQSGAEPRPGPRRTEERGTRR